MAFHKRQSKRLSGLPPEEEPIPPKKKRTRKDAAEPSENLDLPTEITQAQPRHPAKRVLETHEEEEDEDEPKKKKNSRVGTKKKTPSVRLDPVASTKVQKSKKTREASTSESVSSKNNNSNFTMDDNDDAEPVSDVAVIREDGGGRSKFKKKAQYSPPERAEVFADVPE